MMELSHFFSRLDHCIRNNGIKVIPMGIERVFYNVRNSCDSILFCPNEVMFEPLFSDIRNARKFVDLSFAHLRWSGPLIQRYRHLSLAFSHIGGLAIAGSLPRVDGIRYIQNDQINHWIINSQNRALSNAVDDAVFKNSIPVMVRVQSTDLQISISDIERWIKRGYSVLYEYIDPFSPEISVHIPESIMARHKFCCENPSIHVCCTADKLMGEVKRIRSSNVFLSRNAVDLDHWGKHRITSLEELRNKKKPILGYHGALASWVDYELLKKLATTGRYSIVLIGPKYDTSFDDSEIANCENVYYLGAKSYNDLPAYVQAYDVALVPFKVNDLTDAVSPLKLFEYMAAKKPIVTTNLRECALYNSCLISKDSEEFEAMIDLALVAKGDILYQKTLEMEANANSWHQRAQDIIKNVFGFVTY